MLKRLFDIIVAFFLLMLLFPVILYVAYQVKKDGGPVFYRGVRVGLNGIPFKIFKFRSMVVNADKIGGSSTSDEDSRITPIGRIIRKYKLDEISQLINVLRGDMSFVGPRPEVQHYVDMYTAEEKNILTVRPGITDWASLWNNDEGAVLVSYPDPEKAYMEIIRPTKLKLQLKYVKERSFWIDIKILWETFLAVAIKKEPSIISQMGKPGQLKVVL